MIPRHDPRECAPRQAIHQRENSVFPAFMGRPSLEKARANRHQLQTDTTKIAEKPLWVCAVQGGAFQWVRGPPGNRSSRKQPEQSWR
jgi:hypothetical protein